ELRGRELVDRLSQSCDVTVLTGTTQIDAAGRRRRVDVVRPGPRLSWVRDRVSWSIGSLAFNVAARRAVQRLLNRIRPDVIWLNKFSSVAAPALDELLDWGAPTFVWFGDRWAGESMASALAQRGSVGHMHLVFNCEFLKRFYSPVLDR